MTLLLPLALNNLANIRLSLDSPHLQHSYRGQVITDVRLSMFNEVEVKAKRSGQWIVVHPAEHVRVDPV